MIASFKIPSMTQIYVILESLSCLHVYNRKPSKYSEVAVIKLIYIYIFKNLFQKIQSKSRFILLQAEINNLL